MHACMHARVCIYMSLYVCVCVAVCLHAHVYVHACMWYTHTFAFALHSYNFIHVHACVYILTSMTCMHEKFQGTNISWLHNLKM